MHKNLIDDHNITEGYHFPNWCYGALGCMFVFAVPCAFIAISKLVNGEDYIRSSFTP